MNLGLRKLLFSSQSSFLLIVVENCSTCQELCRSTIEISTDKNPRELDFVLDDVIDEYI